MFYGFLVFRSAFRVPNSALEVSRWCFIDSLPHCGVGKDLHRMISEGKSRLDGETEGNFSGHFSPLSRKSGIIALELRDFAFGV